MFGGYVMGGMRFFGRDYFESLKSHYPEEIRDGELRDKVLTEWMRSPAFGADPPNRFQKITERAFSMQKNAVIASRSGQGGPEWLHRLSASRSYRGLLHYKTPFDLVLYSNLIWELQPKTIIEFGALQGGSALWLADQLEACGTEGEVHSFERLDKCIHPSAVHPRLHFHHADLRDVKTLDSELFSRLPHPWLLIDDAHVNLRELTLWIDGYLRSGDYYVVEDILLIGNFELIANIVYFCESLGFLVDSKYTDAFGYNVTCSPNSWFRKV
jgi:cephalosporin hydroxylase